MYIYYKKFESEEHMLYADEILNLFKSSLNNVSTNKVHSIIRNYCKRNNIVNEEIFYNRRNGLKRVYSLQLASDAIADYINRNKGEI